MTLADDILRVQEADQALQAHATPFPLPITGLEAIVVGSLTALQRTDWWVPGLRERAGAVLRDVGLERLSDGFAGALPYKVAPPTPSPALRALHAVGIALGSERPALVHLGIGSTSDGAFTEALNLAALTNAQVLFVVAVHPLDGEAPLGKQLVSTPSALAAAYGIPSTTVSGASAQAVHDAILAARAAGGPHLIQADLPGQA